MAVNPTVADLGQAGGSGDDRALFLKIFSKELLASFHDATHLYDRIQKKTVKGAKSSQFIAYGKLTTRFHAKGQDVLDSTNSYLTDWQKAEKLIHIDARLTASAFVDGLDEIMSQMDDISALVREAGIALAQQYDQYALQKAVMTARESAVITGRTPGGQVDKGATVESDATVLFEGLKAALKQLDINNVPRDMRTIYVRPAEYYLMLQDLDNNPSFFHMDKDINGSGSISDGIVGKYMGADVVMTNNLPSTDLSSAITGDQNDYSADFSNTVALVMHASAIGGIMADEPKVMVEDIPNRLGRLVLGHVACGFGSLRPEAVVEVTKA